LEYMCCYCSIFICWTLSKGEFHVSVSSWETQGDFTTCHPRPVIKIKLIEERSGVLALDDKELGRVCEQPNKPTQSIHILINQWCNNSVSFEILVLPVLQHFFNDHWRGDSSWEQGGSQVEILLRFLPGMLIGNF